MKRENEYPLIIDDEFQNVITLSSTTRNGNTFDIVDVKGELHIWVGTSGHDVANVPLKDLGINIMKSGDVELSETLFNEIQKINKK